MNGKLRVISFIWMLPYLYAVTGCTERKTVLQCAPTYESHVFIDFKDHDITDRDHSGILLKVDKYRENPVISGYLPGSGDQFYPPAVIQTGDTLYAMAKAGRSEIWGYYSTDGEHWTPAPDEARIAGLEPDHESLVIRFEIETGLYHLLTRKRNLQNEYRGPEIWHYTSSHPFGPWMANSNNPVLEIQDFEDTGLMETVVQKSGLDISDVIRVDNRFIYYGNIASDTSTSFFIGYNDSLGSRITPAKLLFNSTQKATVSGQGSAVLQGLNVIMEEGLYYFIYTFGYPSGSEIEINQRRIYISVSKSYDEVQPGRTVLLRPDPCQEWERERNYGSNVLKKQDGTFLAPVKHTENTFRLLYSGSNHPEGVNRGLTGVAEIELKGYVN